MFYVRSKQFITYVLLLLIHNIWEIDLLHLQHSVLYDLRNCQNLGTAALDLGRNFIPNTLIHLLCKRFLCTYSFKYPLMNKPVAVRSDEHTGHGIIRYMKMLFVFH